MKKTVLLFCCASLISMGYIQAQSFLKENFNTVKAPDLPANWESIPEATWKTGNPDVIAPSFGRLYGLQIATTGYTSAVAIDGNQKTSDSAILATPSVNIPAGATTVSAFFDVCFMKRGKEALSFVASTDGGKKWETVSEVSPITATSLWERRKIDLSSYAGKNNVRFGLRYSNAKTNLVGTAIANFAILQGTDLILSTVSAGNNLYNGAFYAISGTNISIEGTVLNSGTDTITQYTVKYQQGANPAKSYSVTTTLRPNRPGTFKHDIPFNIAANNTYPIKVWVEAEGDLNNENDSADITLVGLSQFPQKRIVFEEATGAWCTWCPRGTVAMDEFAENNPGIVAQIAVHNGDAMVDADYDRFLNKYIKGYPSMVVDRNLVDDPSRLPSYYNQYKDMFGVADITLDDVTVDETNVSVKVSIKPVAEIKDAKLALVTTESNLSGEGKGWDQVNAYSGGRNGKMGGWEEHPSPVKGSKFHFVARDIAPSADGAASGLPATMTAGSSYEATITATLKQEWKKENLQYIVLLIGADGKILNSNFTDLPHLEAVLPDGTSITNIDAGINEAVLYPNPAKNTTYLAVNAQDATTATISITDIMGRSVSHPISSKLQAGKNVLTIPTQLLANGSYLVNLTTEKGNTVMKLQVAK